MKIFVAVPLYDGKLDYRLVNCLLAESIFAERCGDELRVNYIGGSAGIAHARNQLVTMFLESDCDRMVFLDSDITFKIGSLVKIAKQKEEIVVGAYRIKDSFETYPIEWLINKELWANENGLLEIDRGPTGFMSIKRCVFDKILEAKPDRKTEVYKGKYNYFFFQMPIENGVLVGEDFYFCREVRDLGMKIYLDPELELTHYGHKPTPFIGHIGKWLKNRTPKEKT
jgi:hypothetical protein